RDRPRGPGDLRRRRGLGPVRARHDGTTRYLRVLRLGVGRALTCRPGRAAPMSTVATAPLPRATRACLAEWSPTWWRQRPGADDLHAAWLAHLVTAEGPVARVVEDGGEVVAFSVAVPQPGQWFVDDASVADAAAWPALLAAVEERPALTCAATRDVDRAAACRDAGLPAASSI